MAKIVQKITKKPIVYLGSTRFSAEVLDTMANNGVDITLAISVPNEIFIPYDNKKLSMQDVCKKHGIKLIRPEKIGEAKSIIEAIEPDLIITCAYGQFLPEYILEIPTHGSWNIHASLLPLLRGGAPIQWAIINNFKETGITIIRMASKMDSGNMIALKKIAIDTRETYGTLYLKLIEAAKQLIVPTIEKIMKGHFTETEQTEEDATFAYVIRKVQAEIDWNRSNTDIDAFVRALNPDPISFTKHDEILYKIYNGQPIDFESNSRPGQIIKVDKTGIFVATLDGTYQITDIQREGKKRLSIKDFVNGERKLTVGSHFNLIS